MEMVSKGGCRVWETKRKKSVSSPLNSMKKESWFRCTANFNNWTMLNQQLGPLWGYFHYENFLFQRVRANDLISCCRGSLKLPEVRSIFGRNFLLGQVARFTIVTLMSSLLYITKFIVIHVPKACFTCYVSLQLQQSCRFKNNNLVGESIVQLLKRTMMNMRGAWTLKATFVSISFTVKANLE